MTIWDSIRKILKSEAADIGDELGKARDKFDEALTRKEEEMAASPKERMDMILDDIEDSDAKLDSIRDKAQGKASQVAAEAEVAEARSGIDPLPAATAEAVETASDPTEEIASAVSTGDSASVDEMVEQRIERESRRAAADAKFEEQKERAGDILDELRGELGIDD